MKTIILKISGKALDGLLVNDSWINMINGLRQSFDSLIIVHGGGVKITEWSNALNIKAEFINGQRITDAAAIDVVAAVQSGLLNSKFVSRLQTNAINAIGLTGIDNGLFTADYLNPELGFVGIPVLTGSTEWIFSLIQSGIVPVFSSICRDINGKLMNVNADLFVKELAVAVNADTVLFFSDIAGVNLNGEVQPLISGSDVTEGIASGEISGGMIPKITNCIELINSGIRKVWIGSHTFNENFTELLFENKLKGTWIVESVAV